MPQLNYLAVPIIYTREVDLGDKLECWRNIRVLFAAVDIQRVDAVLMYALRAAQYADMLCKSI
jgi:hypothetical protein